MNNVYVTERSLEMDESSQFWKLKLESIKTNIAILNFVFLSIAKSKTKHSHV